MSEPMTTPIPVPTSGPDVPKLLVLFGGTFDPPHRGHVELPVRVRDALEQQYECPGGAWLVYVPAARSPHKTKGPAATDADRAEMLRRSLAGVERVCVWTDEADRAAATEGSGEGGAKASFTVDTLARAHAWLAATFPDAPPPMRLLIGADQALSFHKWRAPREIIHFAPPAVMVRGAVEDSDELARLLRTTGFWKAPERESWRGAMIPVGRLDVSASAVRDALAHEDWAHAGQWLAPGVIELIRERGLYQRPG